MQFLLLRRSCRDDIGLLRCGIFNKRKGAEECGSYFSFSQGQGVANGNNNRVLGKPEAIQKRDSAKLPEQRVVESQVAFAESSICNRITLAKMGSSKPDCSPALQRKWPKGSLTGFSATFSLVRFARRGNHFRKAHCP